ncbi:hypothetical protein CYMTET_54845 [Cymbomonas tetramitiformis]|uniref:Uncharacterized protein n=1 Tax=Cymbomonas tetramitiformis TaxID=36881 RepID=A0AAE0BE37_9CHLO|nr:hypothetical protein CYMTET_54845 [Cymbomonas tetramitiformis]
MQADTPNQREVKGRRGVYEEATKQERKRKQDTRNRLGQMKRKLEEKDEERGEEQAIAAIGDWIDKVEEDGQTMGEQGWQEEREKGTGEVTEQTIRSEQHEEHQAEGSESEVRAIMEDLEQEQQELQ